MVGTRSSPCYLGVSLCLVASIPSPCGQGALIGGVLIGIVLLIVVLYCRQL